MTESAARTFFQNHYALADLPYFDLRDGHLILADPELGPSIDIHTHLSLSYGPFSALDLWAEHEHVEHYLPLASSLDIAQYQNLNFSPEALSKMRKDLVWGSLTHAGQRVTHTARNLLREMEELGIARSVILPVDLLGISDNAGSYIKAAAQTDRLISFGCVHPYARNLGDKLEAQQRAGARGLKLHPAVQLVRPDNPRAMQLYGLCGELGLPVLWHCGPVDIEPAAGRRRCQLPLYEAPIAQHPNTRFILGHSGALQFDQALAYAKRYPNVYMGLSSVAYPNVVRLLEEGPAERILLGSDWPFYHQATALAKVYLATEGDPSARRRVLYDNAARLLGID